MSCLLFAINSDDGVIFAAVLPCGAGIGADRGDGHIASGIRVVPRGGLVGLAGFEGLLGLQLIGLVHIFTNLTANDGTCQSARNNGRSLTSAFADIGAEHAAQYTADYGAGLLLVWRGLSASKAERQQAGHQKQACLVHEIKSPRLKIVVLPQVSFTPADVVSHIS